MTDQLTRDADESAKAGDLGKRIAACASDGGERDRVVGEDRVAETDSSEAGEQGCPTRSPTRSTPISWPSAETPSE